MNGWIDAAAGASGDMFLGALIDAGAPVETIQAAIDTLPVEPIRLEVSATERHALGATKVDVIAPHSHHHRHWSDICGMLEAADLEPEVARIALDAFARLARAEAAVHRTSVEDVHFHEVGALDAIADIVGTAAGVVALGLTDLTTSTVTVGSGMSRGEHGRIPIPAPAVLQLLAEAGAPLERIQAAIDTLPVEP
ncbi:MAG TPA: LarC family nickel insertion protein, partial [Mycobacteriales bacterium]|nr:LarC family nickel insertion protein [Mycobacteriales bacterium]